MDGHNTEVDSMQSSPPIQSEFINLGASQLQNGNYRKAKIALEHGLKKALVNGSKQDLRLCRLHLGATYTAVGQPERGLELFEQALLPNSGGKIQGDVLYNMAIAFEKLNDPRKASKCYTNSIKAYRDSKTGVDKTFLSSLAIKAGMLHLHLDKFKQANVCLEIAVEIYKHEDTLPQLCAALTMRAYCLVSLHSTEHALEIIKDCEKISKELPQNVSTGE